MDLDEMERAGRLDESFPLAPDAPFTRSMAIDAGVSRRSLDRLLETGLLCRPVKGVYIGTHVPDSVAVRAACLRLAVPADCVVVDRHAGWLHGAEMVLAPGEHLALRPLSLYRPSGNGRVRTALAASGERNLSPADVVEVDGVRVSSPIRTAWDLGRVRWTDEAICGLDAMLRLERFTRDELLDGIERFRGMRWVTTLREIAPFADGRSESPAESVLRLRCHEAQVRVTPQVEAWRDGELLGRIDLADPDLRLGFEYDGAEWHSTPDQLAHDRRRRAALTEDGWLVRALRCEDVFGRARACDQIIRQAARQARARRGVPTG